MLAATLAKHPDTSTSVLAMLAHHNDPVAATTARVRLHWDNPWDGLNIHALPEEAGTALLTHPNITEAARDELLATTHLSTWSDYAQNSSANPSNLAAIAHVARRHANHYYLNINLAANPATPDEPARHLLELELLRGWIPPASAVAIADNRGINPADLMPHCTSDTAAHMAAYQRAGNLTALLERAPFTTEEPETTLAWDDIAMFSTNTAALRAAADRALDALAQPNTDGPEALLSALLRNTYLPSSAVAAILPRVYAHAHAHKLSPATLADVFTAICAHADTTVELLDTVVSTADPNALIPLLRHPHLTAAHLYDLANLLNMFTPPRLGTRGLLREQQLIRTIARIGLHPNATQNVRQTVREHTPQSIHELSLLDHTIPAQTLDAARTHLRLGGRTIALLRAVHDLPLIPAHIPPLYEGWQDGIELTRVITANINAHPQLMTDPDLAQAALVLAPNHHDTFATLIDTAAGIAHG